ncbi:MAG: acyl-CoA dehydrogenase, partial [Bacteroidales bacterium]
KLTELGRMMSRIVSMDLVIALGEKGYRQDMIENAVSMLRQEITNLVSDYNYEQKAVTIENYQDGSAWQNLVTA